MEQEISRIIEQIKTERDLLKKAKLIHYLKKEKELQTIDIGKRTGLKSSYISHLIRLNKLPPLVVDGYYSKTISPTHLFIISRLSNHEEMIALYEQILVKNLSVLETDKAVRQKIYGIKDMGEFIPESEIESFRRQMDKEGIDTSINQSHIKGKISFQLKGNLETTSKVLRKIMQIVGAGTVEEEESKSDSE